VRLWKANEATEPDSDATHGTRKRRRAAVTANVAQTATHRKNRKVISDKRIPNPFNDKSLLDYINKGLKRIRTFAEILRITKQVNSDFLKQIVKIRDICCHKLESVKTSHLLSIAETMCFLNDKLQLRLETFLLHSQIKPSFKDMIDVDKFVRTDFITNAFNNGIVPEDKCFQFLKKIHKPDFDKATNFAEINERYGEVPLNEFKEFIPTTEDLESLSEIYTTFLPLL
jgi:hypothetical protein